MAPRRKLLKAVAAGCAVAAMPRAAFSANGPATKTSAHGERNNGDQPMDTVKTKDGISIYYKDWGTGQPIVFSHGWPLLADDWDAQMMFFLVRGFRVIAHDRRGHGHSTQTADGHDMDHYADDLAALTAHLDLKNAIRVGTPPAVAKSLVTSQGTGWIAERCVRRAASANRRQPCAVLSGSTHRSFLRLQPGGRKDIPGHHSELVAAGDDGRR